MDNLKGKMALVTGASSGIGKACCYSLAQEGISLVICARRYAKLTELADDIQNKFNVSVDCYSLDVSKRDSVLEFVDTISKKYSCIDILINNAGGALGFDNFQDGSLDDWDMMINTNIKGVLYLSRLIVPLMIENNYGHIVNIGSIAGVSSYPKGAVYCASKAAVKFISDGLRMDTVKENLKVTNIQPGLVETEFSEVRFHGDIDKAKNVYKGIEALKAEDIADIALYCLKAPSHVQITDITVTPKHQASGTVIHRKQ